MFAAPFADEAGRLFGWGDAGIGNAHVGATDTNVRSRALTPRTESYLRGRQKDDKLNEAGCGIVVYQSGPENPMENVDEEDIVVLADYYKHLFRVMRF